MCSEATPDSARRNANSVTGRCERVGSNSISLPQRASRKDTHWLSYGCSAARAEAAERFRAAVLLGHNDGISCSEASLVACARSAMCRLCRLGTRGFAPERLPERCFAARAEAGERLRVPVITPRQCQADGPTRKTALGKTCIASHGWMCWTWSCRTRMRAIGN